MKIHNGNNIDILKTYPDNYFDSIVTDPPYGIEFLGKDWDSNTGAVEIWEQCYRVLKPGGYILAFSAARTYHNLATNIEGVGFEIRDQLMWLYSSGFPKAQDIGKAIDKRANKGQDQTIRAEYNGGKHGPKSVDLSMQGTRCPVCKKDSNARYSCDKGQECGMVYKAQTPEAQQWAGWKTALKPAHEPIVMARKPFKGSCVDNVLTHGVGALNIDATRIDNLTDVEKNWTPQRQHVKSTIDLGGAKPGDTQSMYNDAGRYPSNVIGEVEGYQQYFYCPKVNRAERHIGFENNHPTVKPVALMKYLVKLVTPAGGKVLDPFTGSGSTGMAAVELDYDFTGCELDADYVAIANNRITAWKNKTDLENNLLPEEWFEEE